MLVSFWLKSVYAHGHKRAWWKQLHKLLRQVLRQRLVDAAALVPLTELRAWIEQGNVLTGKAPAVVTRKSEPFRTNLRPERLAPYIRRLLNQWLAAEVASLLVYDGEAGMPQASGIPPLAVGRGLERLLARERLSPGTLELLLRPELLSPRYIYPADAEMFRDVVLALLGRTCAPEPPVMPATLLGVACGSPLPADYREAVRRAVLVESQGREEIHVPIAAEQGLDILKGGPVRIASIIVTMDGRWWESDNLQSGEQYSVVYRPGGRLRIDYSADHAKMDVPWPDTQLRWGGEFQFAEPFEIFGREWHASSWETDGQRTRLHLVFARILPIAEAEFAADVRVGRSRTASIDIAWAAVENALAAAMLQNSREPIEQLRRFDFIPLGRALFEFSQSVRKRGLTKRETIETQLRAIRYLQAQVSLEYGRVPWRILPKAIQEPFLKRRQDSALVQLMNQVFEALPEVLLEPGRQPPASQDAPARSPSQAA